MAYDKYTWHTGEVITEEKLNHMEDGIAAAGATTATATLTAANWSDSTQTVSVTGVTADNMVICSPDPVAYSDYLTAGVFCFSQAAGSLTFKCNSTPSTDLDVNIAII